MLPRLARLGVLVCAALLPAAVRAEPPAKVSGTVTLDGKPLAGATVTFEPVEKGGKKATGKTDENGAYVLTTSKAGDGALPGKYKVTVSVIRADKELVPARYSDKDKTSLTVEVVPKESQIDLNLASK
jgi:hypothetical protein